MGGTHACPQNTILASCAYVATILRERHSLFGLLNTRLIAPIMGHNFVNAHPMHTYQTHTHTFLWPNIDIKVGGDTIRLFMGCNNFVLALHGLKHNEH